ncbi:helix-turn-helix transcriptional regulator [Streptomyces sp. NPDC051320]|uniref:helix-turn-helix domain-containing protein n=1 Tax=Streptomyces sp. NPDC051320 TaxID=3154644 RepID=UPI003439E7BD
MSEAKAGTAPTVLRIVLSKRLGALREAAGVTFDAAAKAIDVTPVTIRRMEKAEVGLKLPYVRQLLEHYAVPAREIAEFVSLARDANKPGWWHDYRDALPDWFSVYVSLEDEATLIRTYEPHYVPGLLQTEDYARAVLGAGVGRDADGELERRVALRLKRQELLEQPNAPALWVLFEEAVLHRPVGGRQVMRGQIERLFQATRLFNVTLQILPFEMGPHIGAFGPFTLFRFEMPELPDIVYTESLSGAAYQDQRPYVSAHLEALDRLSTQARTVEETRKILEDACKDST